MPKPSRIAASLPECFSKQDSLVEVATSGSQAVGSGNPSSTRSRGDDIYAMTGPQESDCYSPLFAQYLSPYQNPHISLLYTPCTIETPHKQTSYTLHTYYPKWVSPLCVLQSQPSLHDIANQQQQLMKAAFPLGFISMEPKSSNSSISADHMPTSKALMPSGAVNQGNDTYKFYDGDGGDGWPGMDKWVDFYSM